MKRNLKKNEAITLVALVVTIIVLVILAGISINLALGDNGIIIKSKDAKKEQTIAKIQEEVILKIFNKMIEKPETEKIITKTEIEEILTPYGEVIKDANDNIKGLKPTGFVEEIPIEKLYEGEIGTDVDSGGIFANQITKDNYGEYVDLETTILARNSEGEIALELELGQEKNITEKEQPLTDWRIFYKDEQGGIYLMLTDYLLRSYNSIVKSGLTGDSTYPYNWRSKKDRIDLLNRLDGTTNSNAWNNLLASKYIDKKIMVKGAIDIELYQKSWNQKSDIQMFLSKISMSDGLDGYYVGNIENSKSEKYNFKDSTAYKDTTLYYPHKRKIDGNEGYLLNAPSAVSTSYVLGVQFQGMVCRNDNGCTLYSIRPVIYIPFGIYATKNDKTEIWTIDLNK